MGDPAPAAVIRPSRTAPGGGRGADRDARNMPTRLPGVLKNALDWIVGSGELMGKPVGLMSASPNRTGGILGQLALIPTLLVMDAVIVAQATVRSSRGSRWMTRADRRPGTLGTGRGGGPGAGRGGEAGLRMARSPAGGAGAPARRAR